MSSGFQSSTIARFPWVKWEGFTRVQECACAGFVVSKNERREGARFSLKLCQGRPPSKALLCLLLSKDVLTPCQSHTIQKAEKKVSQLRPWERSWRCQHSDRSFSEHRWSGGPFFTGLTPVFKSSEWLTLRLRQNQFHLITNSWLRVSKSWNTENKNNV